MRALLSFSRNAGNERGNPIDGDGLSINSPAELPRYTQLSASRHEPYYVVFYETNTRLFVG